MGDPVTRCREASPSVPASHCRRVRTEAMDRNCINCGRQLRPRAKFCSACRARIRQLPQVAQAALPLTVLCTRYVTWVAATAYGLTFAGLSVPAGSPRATALCERAG